MSMISPNPMQQSRRVGPKCGVMMLALFFLVSVLFQVMMPAANAASLEERLGRIIIPKVELEEARLEEVIDWLRQSARKHDPRECGVNLIVKLDNKAKNKKITLNLRKIPFDDLLRYICILADLNYRVTDKVVYIYSGELPSEEMKTRYYHIKDLPIKSG